MPDTQKLIKPRMVLFDYGGTLAKETPFDALAATRALMRHATRNRDNLSAAQVAAFAEERFWALDPVRLESRVEIHNHMHNRFVYEYLGLSFDLTPLEQELVYWNAGSTSTPMEGAADFLAVLRAQGIRTGVISNIMYSGEALKARLAHLFPEHAFEFVIATSEYVYRKPSHFIFELALRKAGLAPEEVWYCGDRFDCDAEGASAVGMRAVWLCPGYDGRALPEGCRTIDGWKTLTAAFV